MDQYFFLKSEKSHSKVGDNFQVNPHGTCGKDGMVVAGSRCRLVGEEKLSGKKIFEGREKKKKIGRNGVLLG